MTNPLLHCDQRQLDALIDDSASGPDVRLMEAHLASCETCQQRLTELAADETWWRDAQENLRGRGKDSWQPDVSQVGLDVGHQALSPPSLDTSVRELLAPGSHPEMLGRLGRYDIERIIGSGGMGIVLKAHDSELNRPIAIKVLAPYMAHVGAARERFAREGRAAAAVVHEHVVAIHNVETSGRVPFLVMQFVPGRSLQARVDDAGPLELEEILRIALQAASGLAAAHAQGLVHRDVKPANILLEDSVERAVLTDFGLARTMDDASLTCTGVVTGTPHYMSPEQAAGEAVDCRSDLFSLGGVLYFMAAGHPPFRAVGALAVLHRITNDRQRPVWQSNKDIPDELSDLIDRLLEKKPSRRPASAAEVAEQLAAILNRVQQFGSGQRRLDILRSRRGRRRALRIAAAAILAMVTTFVVWKLNDSDRHVRTDGPGTADGVEELDLGLVIAQAATQAGELQHEFAAAQDALRQAEQVSYRTLSGPDTWQEEVGSLGRELSAMESDPGFSP